MTYCITSIKLFNVFLVKRKNLNAFEAVVSQRESAIFPGFFDANFDSRNSDDMA